MKTAMKIIFAPIVALMWILIKIGIAVTYISGLASGMLSGLFAIVSVVYLITGATKNGIIGLVIAYLLSPYGIPLFAIITLGAIQQFKDGLQDKIYG